MLRATHTRPADSILIRERNKLADAGEPSSAPQEDDGDDPLAAVITGTTGSEVLNGTNDDDIIDGMGGDDTVFAGGGNDRIIANTSGVLTVNGQGGIDTLVLGASATLANLVATNSIEIIETPDGGSMLTVLPQLVTIEVDMRGITVVGGPITLIGSSRWGRYDLTAQNDVFISNMVDALEIEQVYAGNGDDVISGHYGRYYGEGGDDTIRSARSVSLEGTVTLDGGAGNDTLYTSGAAAIGGAGSDRIIAEGASLGIVQGGAGFDVYVMRDGDVTQNLIGDPASAPEPGPFSGVELIEATASAGWIILTPDLTNGGQRGSNLNLSSVISVTGGGRIRVSGTEYSDVIAGTNASDAGDVISAGAADDVVTGGRGNDEIDGGAGSDTAVYTLTRLSSAYIFRAGDVTWVYTPGEGVDRLTGIETLRFEGDGVVSTVSVDVATTFPVFSYVASYDDLITQFGANNPAGALANWQATGQAAGRNPNLFDALQYAASYNDLIAAYGNDVGEAARHYIAYGSAEGRSRDAFDAYQYAAGYDDLALAFGTDEGRAAAHFISFGLAEGRQRDNFDAYQYLASYADARAFAGTNETLAAQHFLEIGIQEGLARDSFDELQYLASYGDLIETYGENLAEVTRHYVHFGAAEGRAVDLFDAEQYVANYPDLQAAYGSDLREATRHYINFGYYEGRTDEDLTPSGGDDGLAILVDKGDSVYVSPVESDMAVAEKAGDPAPAVLPDDADFGALSLARDDGFLMQSFVDTSADLRAKGIVMPPEWAVLLA